MEVIKVKMSRASLTSTMDDEQPYVVCDPQTMQINTKDLWEVEMRYMVRPGHKS